MAVKEERKPSVEISKLRFTYPGIDGHPPPGSTPLIDDFSLTLFPGDRYLLVGSNGAGKTTILKILGGKHMVEPDMVRVLGRSAFHDTALTASGDLCYLGGEWRREVAFAGFEVPIQMDVSAQKMIFGVAGVNPQRRDELIKIWVPGGPPKVLVSVSLWEGTIEAFLTGKFLRNGSIFHSFISIAVLCASRMKRQLTVFIELPVVLELLASFILFGMQLIAQWVTPFTVKEVLGIDLSWRLHKASDGQRRRVYVAHGRLQLAMPMDKVKEISNLSLMKRVNNAFLCVSHMIVMHEGDF
nr:ABC transporter I family member 20 [Ipomoea batatas]